MLEELRAINDDLIIKYKNEHNKLERQLMISNFLKQDRCFFKVSMEVAVSILRDLEISDPMETYLNLVSYKSYINW